MIGLPISKVIPFLKSAVDKLRAVFEDFIFVNECNDGGKR